MTMDHAAAHERIADLALEPDGLDGLDGLDLARPVVLGPEDRALAEHIRACPTCSADVAATRALRDRLRMALAGADAPSLEPIAAPDWLRDAVVGAVRAEPRLASASGSRRPAAGLPAPTESRSAHLPRRWLRRWGAPQWAAGIAAALAIAIVGGLAGSAISRLGGGGPEPSMVAVVATLDRVLAAPDHRVAQLRTTAGLPAGSVAWSSSDFAVLTSSLTAPSADRVYRCWLEWSGRWASVGIMEFAGGTAYWTGPTGEWTAILAEPGTRFVVTLEPAGAAGERPAGGTILQASLTS